VMEGLNMKGSSHALVGGVVGGLVSLGTGNDLVSTGTVTLTVAGTVAGLIPDLDTNGKLSNKITFSHRFIKSIMMLLGLVVIAFGMIKGEGLEKVYGLGVGLGFIIASKYITQRRMQMVTGLGVTILGVTMGIMWVILLGVYVLISSKLSHRGHTHSVIGIVYFGYMAFLMQQDLHID